MSGWVKIHRSITEWRWYPDLPTRVLFLHLIMVANHEDRAWLQHTIKRGQRATSVENLANETGLSVRQVRTALDKLKSTNEVAIQSSNKYSIITIVNYNLYQQKGGQSDKQATNEGQTSDNNIRSKEDKNISLSKTRASLDELSVDHVLEWLSQKRAQGRYLMHDEHFVLEKFKDFCRANNKKYSDYVAAYKNAFDWKQFTGGTNGSISNNARKDGTYGGKPSVTDEVNRINAAIAEGRPF